MAFLTDQQLLELAAAHHQAGRFAEAEAIYRRLLGSYPGHPGLLNELGILAMRSGRPVEARQWFEQAVAADSQRADFLNNLGMVLEAMGEFAPAAVALENALRCDPKLGAAFYNLGNVRMKQGELSAARDLFRQALECDPAHPQAHLNLGLALSKMGQLDEAVTAYRAGLARASGFAPLWNNLGNALKNRGDHDGAIHAYQAGLAGGADALCINNLGDSLLESGRAAEASECFRQAVTLNPTLHEAHSNLIFSLHLLPESTPEQIAAEAHRWWTLHGEPIAAQRRWHHNDRSPERRLRIGYVSPDFRAHPVGRHMLPIVLGHDRKQFEVFCYSDVNAADELTTQFREAADHWRDTARMTDVEIADAVARDRIDILIDLALHTHGNRLLVFARKPAPVQVTFAGYPGTTGLGNIDYRLTDRFLEPPDLSSEHGAEEPIGLAGSFWLFEGEANELPERAADHRVVLGGLSKFTKVNPRVVALWSRVLRGVPEARLVLLCPEGESRERVAEQFEREGIARERIECVARSSRAEFLALLGRVDLLLDTFPYNAHTTLCEALWMGVPAVSLVGETAVSRGGLSILSQVDLGELAVSSEDEYVRVATRLANDLSELSGLRTGLRERMRRSPLMDAAAYVRDLEQHFRVMWQRWCAAEGTRS